MFRVFEGRTADDVWCKIAQSFREENAAPQSSRSGPSHELLHSAISVAEPTQRWVLSRTPPINVAFALAEVIWIMAGRNTSAFLNYFNRDLPKFAGHGPSYHGAYGHRLRNHLAIDQLERAYQALRKNPESRQVVLQIWDGSVDLPNSDGMPLSPDIPCNIAAMLKVRSGALEWTQIMRSNDVFRGLPYNIVQFTSMQEIMAGWLNLKVGSYNHVSDSLHVYQNDLNHVRSYEKVEANVSTDCLALSKPEYDLHFPELERSILSVTDSAISADVLFERIQRSGLPSAYQNILCVVSAEGTRRRDRHELIVPIMALCTNRAYQQLYSRWCSRFSFEAASNRTDAGHGNALKHFSDVHVA